ncbi:MAG: hypothetical protein ACREO7_01285 [Pseudoxanthomonas sp.]
MNRVRLHRHTLALVIAAVAGCVVAPAVVAGNVAGKVADPGFGPWGDPQYVVAINTTAAAEGCPIESPDGRELYIASNRSAPGAQGKLDIYRAFRSRNGQDWTQPENLGTPVNTPEFDYCPTPLPGHWLLFISSRAEADDCYPGAAAPSPAAPGAPAPGDIYLSIEFLRGKWLRPLHLGCYPNGPSTAGAEFSPSLLPAIGETYLYFSSDGYPDSQGQDIYMSRILRDGTVTPGKRVAELSTAADDRMPNVRRDGLEIVFSSNRAGATPFNQDIYVATRKSIHSPWSAPKRIENPFVNTPGSETRATLSGDGTRLYFGRKVNADDPGDVFVSTRSRSRGR